MQVQSSTVEVDGLHALLQRVGLLLLELLLRLARTHLRAGGRRRRPCSLRTLLCTTCSSLSCAVRGEGGARPGGTGQEPREEGRMRGLGRVGPSRVREGCERTMPPSSFCALGTPPPGCTVKLPLPLASCILRRSSSCLPHSSIHFSFDASSTRCRTYTSRGLKFCARIRSIGIRIRTSRSTRHILYTTTRTYIRVRSIFNRDSYADTRMRYDSIVNAIFLRV